MKIEEVLLNASIALEAYSSALNPLDWIIAEGLADDIDSAAIKLVQYQKALSGLRKAGMFSDDIKKALK